MAILCPIFLSYDIFSIRQPYLRIIFTLSQPLSHKHGKDKDYSHDKKATESSIRLH